MYGMPRRTLKKYRETICALLTLVVEFCFDYVRRDWLINIKLLRERENTKVCVTKLIQMIELLVSNISGSKADAWMRN
jgi:hypothetical protein